MRKNISFAIAAIGLALVVTFCARCSRSTVAWNARLSSITV
jgi:hypothetical protein